MDEDEADPHFPHLDLGRVDDGAGVNYPRRVDRLIPPPDVLATEVDEASRVGTAKGLAAAARRAGWEVRATRALGPRLPRQVQQDVERAASLALAGVMHGWRFTATLTERDGWEVVLHRPGWPPALANVTALRKVFAAQTPAVLR